MKTFEIVVIESAQKYNIPTELIYAIIKQETNFIENAVGTSGEKGFMQLMDATARDMGWNGKDNLQDFQVNIPLGTKYIRWLINYLTNSTYSGHKKGDEPDLRDVISAYNMGGKGMMNSVNGIGSKRKYSNQKYVSNVHGHYRTLLAMNSVNKFLPIGLGIVGVVFILDKLQARD